MKSLLSFGMAQGFFLAMCPGVTSGGAYGAISNDWTQVDLVQGKCCKPSIIYISRVPALTGSWL